MFRTRSSQLLALLFSLWAAISGAQDDELQVLDLETPPRMDFSGYWEKDFQRSDNWEEELGRQLSNRQLRAANQAAGISSSTGPAVNIGSVNLNRRNRGSNIIELARVAEYVTRQNTLMIDQDRDRVSIQRDGEAPLLCSLDIGTHETFVSAHGREICGWDRQHLIFEIALPDNLFVTHRYTVSSDGQLLRVQTSIRHRNSTQFTLTHAYNRFQAPPDEYNCITTLTRGNVCSQVTPLE